MVEYAVAEVHMIQPIRGGLGNDGGTFQDLVNG